MKLLVKNLKFFSIGILLIIFSLQTVWLYQTFLLTKKNLQKNLFEKSIVASQIEVGVRNKEMMDSLSNVRKHNEGEHIFEMPPDSLWVHKNFPIEIMALEFLHHFNSSLNLKRIDSTLRKNNLIVGDFVINRINTLDDTIIESTAAETESQWDKALKTEEIPMRLDKSESFQLLLLNPNWSIFIQMAYIILLSLIMVVIVALALWWQYNSYLKEKKIRQFQKDHTEATVHNMVTPLQTISIANKTLLENAITEPEKQLKFLKAQSHQIDNLQNQVEKILTVSRANNSGIILKKAVVDIEELINTVCDSFKHKRKKEVHIEKHFALSEKTIEIDAQLFSDVLNNLIENAIKYSGATVNIVIRTELTAQRLKVKVADDGFGIAPKYQSRIFDKFNRGAAPFRDGAKGFGIGLSFVKVVVEAHKGTVELFSKGENKGTTFTIRIPQVAD